MPTSPRHFKDELQDWLDGRLDAATCDEVERHLESCAECRREYEAVAWTKREAARLAAAEAPPELRENILRALRAESSPDVVIAPPPSFWKQRLRPILAVAAVVLFLAVGSFWLLSQPSLPEIAARDFVAYRAEQLALELSTRDVKQMESYFAEHGVTFNTRVFDLGMMKYELVGGRVQKPGRAPRALFVYRGPANQKLVCEMFIGQVGELPKGATVRENNGLRFYTYQAKGVTAVFWQEGSVVCALVSDIAPEEVVQLAFAKAMPPRGGRGEGEFPGKSPPSVALNKYSIKWRREKSPPTSGGTAAARMPGY